MKWEKTGEHQVAVFARYPQLGKCKTRLARDIGPEKALHVYQSLLTYTLGLLQGGDFRHSVWVTPDAHAKNQGSWAPGNGQRFPQGGGDLGQRLENCCRFFLIDQKVKSLLIIGTDCVELEADHLERALARLEEVDVVLGPANDGGYYLIGLRKMVPELFRNISWSTAQVLQQTISVLKTKNLSYFCLPELVDIDTFTDLTRFRDAPIFRDLNLG
ncbi:MAG: glycosyltransferase [Okeania sp. SIO1H5]|nr:glycosyltransferase [Okeania sp. SIO1H5]